MSSSSTPRLTASPAPPPLASTTATTTKPSKPATKPTNVFSNDGSFLERFQRTKKEEEDKKKEQEALARKREFDNRFKNRRKRRMPDETPDTPADTTTVDEGQSSKKAKPDNLQSDYERQVQSYTSHGLKDGGTGVRPLVK